jgi:hypothetical protein
MSFIIPLNPVDIMAPTNDKNFRQFLSLIISVNTKRPSAKLRDSNPPDFDIFSKILSIDRPSVMEISWIGLPD